MYKESVDFPPFPDSRLLVHIAFHYNEARFDYLFRVLSEIGSYNFKNIDVYIDTNSNKLSSRISEGDYPGISGIKVLLHDNLDHPFLLTWKHRENIESLKNQYDYFMYIEDDIAVTYDALQRWRDDSVFLDPYGKIRGFIRTEINSKNETVSTDYVKPVRCKDVLFIDKRTFIAPQNPYQGFWFYSKKQFDDFYASECWINGNCDWEVRERASAGMIWKGGKSAKDHCLVVPLIDLTIPDYVYVSHLPNNYAMNKKEKHGSLKISGIMPENMLFRLCLGIRKMLADNRSSVAISR